MTLPSIPVLLLYTFVMAAVTYLIRTLPFVIFRRPIRSRFIKSFLYYIPYAVLGAMTFPAILFCTDSLVSAVCGLLAAVVFAYFGGGLLTVAVAACAAVYLAELIGRFL